MLFAEEQVPEIVHWVVSGGVLTVIGAIGLWITRVIKTWNTGSRAKRKDLIDELYDLNSKLLLQIDRGNAALAQQQEALDAYVQSDANCRVALSEARTCIRFLYASIKGLHNTVRTLGGDPGELPELPPMSEPPHDAKAEFLARQASQSAKVVQQAGQALKNQPPSNGGQL